MRSPCVGPATLVFVGLSCASGPTPSRSTPARTGSGNPAGSAAPVEREAGPSDYGPDEPTWDDVARRAVADGRLGDALDAWSREFHVTGDPHYLSVAAAHARLAGWCWTAVRLEARHADAVGNEYDEREQRRGCERPRAIIVNRPITFGRERHLIHAVELVRRWCRPEPDDGSPGALELTADPRACLDPGTGFLRVLLMDDRSGRWVSVRADGTLENIAFEWTLEGTALAVDRPEGRRVFSIAHLDASSLTLLRP